MNLRQRVLMDSIASRRNQLSQIEEVQAECKITHKTVAGLLALVAAKQIARTIEDLEIRLAEESASF